MFSFKWSLKLHFSMTKESRLFMTGMMADQSIQEISLPFTLKYVLSFHIGRGIWTSCFFLTWSMVFLQPNDARPDHILWNLELWCLPKNKNACGGYHVQPTTEKSQKENSVVGSLCYLKWRNRTFKNETFLLLSESPRGG